ncbi:MAG: hypothetical protein E7269_07970 [Lachnospiraceae bacterium]|nr:hypothetical protein [Lachnospiraceae bacterium]
MLKGILSSNTCANCRMCCIFEQEDVWEVPLLCTEDAAYIKENYPDIEMEVCADGLHFVMEFPPNGEDASCPMLSEKGCLLGEHKPFDCKIWPYRLMEKDGSVWIAVASLCDVVTSQGKEALLTYYNNVLECEVKAYYRANPGAVKRTHGQYIFLREV